MHHDRGCWTYNSHTSVIHIVWLHLRTWTYVIWLEMAYHISLKKININIRLMNKIQGRPTSFQPWHLLLLLNSCIIKWHSIDTSISYCSWRLCELLLSAQHYACYPCLLQTRWCLFIKIQYGLNPLKPSGKCMSHLL